MIHPLSAPAIRRYSPGDVRQWADRYGEETFSEYGHWILKPDREKMRDVLRRFFDTKSPRAAEGKIALTDPSWVRIEVQNGTGQPRVAAKTRDLLQAHGWQVILIDDADRSTYDHTIVVNYSGISAALIEQLSTDLRLPTTLPTLDLDRLSSSKIAQVDIRIVVGSDLLPTLR